MGYFSNSAYMHVVQPRFKHSYSWVSRDVIISLGVNSKSMHSHRREIVFHCMCWPCVWQQICAISWDLFTPLQHNHEYILGWPPLRLTAKYPSETQELANTTYTGPPRLRNPFHIIQTQTTAAYCGILPTLHHYVWDIFQPVQAQLICSDMLPILHVRKKMKLQILVFFQFIL